MPCHTLRRHASTIPNPILNLIPAPSLTPIPMTVCNTCITTMDLITSISVSVKLRLSISTSMSIATTIPCNTRFVFRHAFCCCLSPSFSPA